MVYLPHQEWHPMNTPLILSWTASWDDSERQAKKLKRGFEPILFSFSPRIADAHNKQKQLVIITLMLWTRVLHNLMCEQHIQLIFTHSSHVLTRGPGQHVWLHGCCDLFAVLLYKPINRLPHQESTRSMYQSLKTEHLSVFLWLHPFVSVGIALQRVLFFVKRVKHNEFVCLPLPLPNPLRRF